MTRGHSAQDTGLKVTWEAPDFVGGTPVTHYELRYRTPEYGDEGWIYGEWQSWPQTLTGTTTTITGLEAGVAYGVHVRAINANGPGQWSFEGFGRTGDPDHICESLD